MRACVHTHMRVRARTHARARVCVKRNDPHVPHVQMGGQPGRTQFKPCTATETHESAAATCGARMSHVRSRAVTFVSSGGSTPKLSSMSTNWLLLMAPPCSRTQGHDTRWGSVSSMLQYLQQQQQAQG